MTSPDNEMLKALGRVLDQIDETTMGNAVAAKSALDWHDFDVKVAQLVFDSAIDQLETDLVMRGSSDGKRRMTFVAGEVTIELEMSETGLVGQIVPPRAGSVELHHSTEETRIVAADEFGVFQIRDLAAGPTTLVARAADNSWSVRTAWTVN